MEFTYDTTVIDLNLVSTGTVEYTYQADLQSLLFFKKPFNH
eukprot:SAG11_NODE_8046_length_1065_cov_1.317805_1_plen_40_part_10